MNLKTAVGLRKNMFAIGVFGIFKIWVLPNALAALMGLAPRLRVRRSGFKNSRGVPGECVVSRDPTTVFSIVHRGEKDGV